MRLLVRLAVGLLPVALLLALALVLDVGGLRTAVTDESADNRNGNGFRYAGSFYWVSGQEVSPASVGELVERRVPYQDTTVALRRLVGVKPSRALAARISGMWTLAASDVDEGADPASVPRLRSTLRR